MKNNNIKATLVALAMFSITACSAIDSHVGAINGKTLKGEDRISLKDSNIYLVNGGDGRMKTFTSLGKSDEEAKGSGKSALNIASGELSKVTQLVIIENKNLSENEALEVAQLNKSDYLIYSRVEEWTDPLGISCGEYYADQASVLLSIYSVEDKKLVNTSRLAATDCPPRLNGIPLSTGSPESLYTDLFSKWLDGNFKK